MHFDPFSKGFQAFFNKKLIVKRRMLESIIVLNNYLYKVPTYKNHGYVLFKLVIKIFIKIRNASLPQRILFARGIKKHVLTQEKKNIKKYFI